jgi:outer membrane murein-binding lipoprotein Lpp|tara:strand:- start:2938 stop:3141 length:204 start_codon:yes stop_codon:yes gene_type:complete
MPFVKEERYIAFVSEVDGHADETNLAIETLSNDVSKLRAEIKVLQDKVTSLDSPAPKAKTTTPKAKK